MWSDMDHFSSNSEIFTLRYGNLYFAIWESLLYDIILYKVKIEIFILRYGNLYFAIWESLFCDMILHKVKTEIFTLRYEKIYFVIWDTNDKTPKNVFCVLGHILNIEHSTFKETKTSFYQTSKGVKSIHLLVFKASNKHTLNIVPFITLNLENIDFAIWEANWEYLYFAIWEVN